MLRRGPLAIATAIAGLLAIPGGAGAAIVNNGDFETGSLSGWQTSNSPVSTTDSWVAYSGTTTPFYPVTVDAPPQGTFAAVTQQGGAGRRLLYQDIPLPPGGSQTQLNLFVYYRTSPLIASPASLDPTVMPNQQYRIDVIRPTAPLDSLASGDILLTVFRTQTGDPSTLSPTRMTADLSPLAGQTIRLRFAEVDNQGVFAASTDAVAVNTNAFTIGNVTRSKKKGTAKVPVTVPEAGTLDVSGTGLKASFTAASTPVAAGTSNVVIKAKGKTKKKLNSRGKAKVNVSITYTPTGVSAATQQVKIKLKKKPKRR